MNGRAILTAAEMRAAEQRAIASGTPVETLMERAGTAAAEAIWRFAGPLPALVLCGPGNNGGDGYVIARALARRGVSVRLAALDEPRTPAARAALASWAGETLPLDKAAPAPLLIDALFGTGLTRPLDEAIAGRLRDLARQAQVVVAIDLPSGVATDNGAILSPVPGCDLTITFQTKKPSHLLQPAARHMGRIVVADIGIEAASDLRELARPQLDPPGPDDHKYRRGYVAVVGGAMPGAAALAASAALSGGAGYVRLVAEAPVAGLPHAIVQAPASDHGLLGDPRIGAVAAGPGLGRGEQAEALLDRVLGCERPLVLDADALVLLEGGLKRLHPLRHVPILTPHAGEFARLFGEGSGSKVDRARAAAARASAVIVFKGADTVIASPDGRAAIAAPAPAWLATAGTGDVLAGAIAAMRATREDAFAAACAGVWLHGRAAALAGPALIADQLVTALRDARMECL